MRCNGGAGEDEEDDENHDDDDDDSGVGDNDCLINNRYVWAINRLRCR